jgi:hypothetical protein
MNDYEPLAIKPWEVPDSWAGKPWHGWYVGLGRNRDSDTLTESNFRVFLKALRELPEVYVDDSENASQSWRYLNDDWSEVDSVQVVQESHWACGWIDWIAIHPDNQAALQLADEMLCALSDYPILNECDWSELQDEAVNRQWEQTPLHWRIDMCRDNGDSIFAARRDYPPENTYDRMREEV